MRVCETGGFQRFLALLLSLTQATHSWKPPGHGHQNYLLAADMTALKAKISAFVAGLDPNSVTLHWDMWEDRHKRHWLGAYIFTLHPETWKPMNILVAFEQVAVWTGGESGHSWSSESI